MKKKLKEREFILDRQSSMSTSTLQYLIGREEKKFEIERRGGAT